VLQQAVSALGFTSSERRREGYCQALAAAGVIKDTDLIRLGPHGPANAEALAAELLALPEPPTAIFAASDTQAMGVLAAADRLGVAVPGELSVIGFDDVQLASLIGLSTVRQPLEESGAEGARRLCALLRGEQVRPLRQLLALDVVQRESTGGPGCRNAGGGVPRADLAKSFAEPARWRAWSAALPVADRDPGEWRTMISGAGPGSHRMLAKAAYGYLRRRRGHSGVAHVLRWQPGTYFALEGR
jgi:hypothetical protein